MLKTIKWLAGSALPAIAVVTAAGTVWACTSVMGQLSVTPSSLAPSDAIVTSAVGLKAAPARYTLRFADSVAVSHGVSCMSSTATLLKKNAQTYSTGNWDYFVAQIPSSAADGVGQLCGTEEYPSPGQTGTTHIDITIIGGPDNPPPPVLWRAGANTDSNFTPRPIFDTSGYPQNGLSTYATQSQACAGSPNSKQAWELSLYKLESITDLTVEPDRTPGIAGHFFLNSPTVARFQAWANTRPGLLTNPPSNGPDPITTAIRTTAILGSAPCP